MPTPNPHFEEYIEARNLQRKHPRSQKEALVIIREAMDAIRRLQSGAWCAKTPKMVHGFLKVAMTGLLYAEEWCIAQHKRECMEEGVEFIDPDDVL